MKKLIIPIVSMTLFVDRNTAAQVPQAGEIPTFQVDPSWPKKLPNNWVFGPVSGLTVDDQDHIWLITRPNEKWRPEQRTRDSSASRAQFDAAGNFLQRMGRSRTGLRMAHDRTRNHRGSQRDRLGRGPRK